ncbi:MAG TPA: CAP domain-containing protein [Kofleriaceae bacterium]|jgi:uncharacterized protein YkwD
MRWLGVALIGCAAHAGHGTGEAPSSPLALAAAPVAPVIRWPVRFAPAGEPADRYNEPQAEVPRTALGDAVTAAVRDAAVRAGLPAPRPDARLFRACADLAELVPDHIAGGRLDDAVVEFALQRNGIIEPAVHLLFGWGDLGAPGRFVDQLQPRLAQLLHDGAPSRLGVGVAQRLPDGTGAIVFAVQGSAVSTRPIPRAVPPDGDIAIDAVIDPRFHDPEVFVTDEHGDTRQVATRPGRPDGFVTEIACRARHGRRQIEITASDASGATVLANFPVWCAADPPRALTIDRMLDDAPPEDAADAERRLLADINRDRAAAGLPDLIRDDAIAAVARGHAEDMRRTGAVAHVSATTGSAVDRLRAAGIRSRIVLENVARAYGVRDAHQALMSSPGHRANLMSAMATHVGVGVALGDEIGGRRELFITELFAAAVATARR